MATSPPSLSAALSHDLPLRPLAALLTAPGGVPRLGSTAPDARPVLLVFSHLRWSFVWQRPQQLVSRLAERWRIVFVEEPVQHDGPARLESSRPLPGIEVLVPHTPVAAPGFHDDQLALLEPLLATHLRSAGLQVDVAWLYTPMALPLALSIPSGCIVHDCMDELSAFKGAPRQLRQRETALLKRADLVLTGGPSLYEARRHRHEHVACIPSSVDAAHFDLGRRPPDLEAAARAAALQGHLPWPRLGWFGVIDERFDPELVAAVADANPAWQLVMVGPVVKVDPASMPQRPNLHWLGMQPYDLLPHLLAGWDVALMPFALNHATRYISPTKTLEYLAGGKPVVSTPVHDVVAGYGDVVRVAQGPEAFVQACRDLLAEDSATRHARRAAMAAKVAGGSWDRAAERVHGLLVEALARAARRRAGTCGPGRGRRVGVTAGAC